MVENQIRKRILTISQGDFWPGITHQNVGGMEYSVWAALAVSCDAKVEARERAHQEMKARARHG